MKFKFCKNFPPYNQSHLNIFFIQCYTYLIESHRVLLMILIKIDEKRPLAQRSLTENVLLIRGDFSNTYSQESNYAIREIKYLSRKHITVGVQYTFK